jgi:general secretion pathway protein N
MRSPPFLIPVLALAVLFFGWRTYEAWTTPMAPSLPPPAARAAVAPAGLSPADPPPPADLPGMAASILARPVFRPDRTPFREETAQAPKRNYDAEMSRFTLLGVLLLGSEKKGVVVGKAGTGRQERWEVGPGDALPGFTVKDIGADGITLAADGKEFLLPLYAGGPKGPPGQAPVRTDVGPPRAPAAAPQPAPPAKGGTAPGAAPSVPPLPPTAAPPPQAATPGTGMPAPREPLDYNRGRLLRPSYLPGRR